MPYWMAFNLDLNNPGVQRIIILNTKMKQILNKKLISDIYGRFNGSTQILSFSSSPFFNKKGVVNISKFKKNYSFGCMLGSYKNEYGKFFTLYFDFNIFKNNDFEAFKRILLYYNDQEYLLSGMIYHIIFRVKFTKGSLFDRLVIGESEEFIFSSEDDHLLKILFYRIYYKILSDCLSDYIISNCEHVELCFSPVAFQTTTGKLLPNINKIENLIGENKTLQSNLCMLPFAGGMHDFFKQIRSYFTTKEKQFLNVDSFSVTTGKYY